MRKISKIVKSLTAMMLAFAIAFSFAPVQAQAAAPKLRTGALKEGKSFRIETTLPGGIKLHPKVKVTSVSNIYYSYYGYIHSYVTMKVEYSNKDIATVARNAKRILTSAPVTKKVGYTTYYRGWHDTVGAVIDVNTGKAPNGYMSASWRKGGATKYKYMKQDGARWFFDTQYNYYFETKFYPKDAGRFALGVGGVSKATFNNDKKVNAFFKGNRTIVGTNAYNKGNKKLSMWLKY